jgi:hypothetical protein
VICPSCNSSDLKRVSLIHAAGLYESRGRIRGLFLGGADGWLFGRYRGTNKSQLSKMAGPPAKMPYVGPTTLWLVGFFPIMAFVSRGKLSVLTGLVSVGYTFLLPAYLLGALFYNFVPCPKKYRKWHATFMYQRCGALIEPQAGARSIARA